MRTMRFTRTVALIMVALMLLQVLAACKGNKNSNNNTTTTGNAATTVPTGSDFSGESITLLDSDTQPVIYIDAEDSKQSVRAVNDLAEDFKRVSEKKPQVVNDFANLENSEVAIIIGTLGHSELIDGFAENGTINVSEIEGQWEAYSITVVENIEPGIKTAIIIAGSDKRGTVFGTYELSEQIGVSPWYYWGDVEIEHKDTITLAVNSLEQTEKPDVKYRGIFLNDEELFTAWSKKFENPKNLGHPNPEVYATVFELILRLKANTLWPAMHAGTDAFNEYKNPKTGVSYNAELADDYGVVMSASHCEMMLRNNEGEWENWAKANAKKYNIKQVNNSWRSAYDYTVNAKAMNAYWEERVAENYRFENIYMIGLRGVHDSGINCSKLSDTSYKSKAAVVKSAVQAQLEILEKYEKLYEEETGEAIKFQTAYCVYKEAAEYFKYDLALPADCCLVYCDDNYGYVRAVPTEEDFAKYSSFGMYYHISYHGAPYSYLWVNNLPLELMAEEMRKSYFSGMKDLWVLNVGDIKPGEAKTEYFMDLAWDVGSHTENNTEEFYIKFLKQNFDLDTETSTKFASTLVDFYQIMHNYMPEHMGKRDLEYSASAWGGETMIIVNKMQKIVNESLAIMNSLPEGKKASYYEMFHYTIYCYLLSVEKYAYKSMNEICIEQGRFAAANIYADLSESAYNAILAESEYYNRVNAGGKWSGILNPYGGVAKVDSGAPSVTRFSVASANGGVGLAAEMQEDFEEAVTLLFGSLNDDTRFIDIYNKGAVTDTWSLSAPVWIIIKDADGNILDGTAAGSNIIYSGNVEVEARYYLSIDWSRFSAGETKTAEIVLTDNKASSDKVNISAYKSSSDTAADINAGHKGYYEENGILSIEAEHYSKIVNQGGYSWTYFDSVGRSGGSMKATCDEGFGRDKVTTGYTTKSPYLDYEIYFSTAGEYTGYIYRLPTLNESASGRTTCSIAYSFDGGSVKTIRGVVAADDSGSSAWGNMIMMQVDKLKISVDVEEAGWHTFRIYMSDANMIIDQIELYLATYEFPYSRLAIPETFNTVSWTKAPTSYLPSLSFDMVNWMGYSQRFDFTKEGTSAHQGYTKVEASGDGSEDEGWQWIPGSDATGYNHTVTKYEIVDQTFAAGKEEATFRIWTNPNTKLGFTIAVGDPSDSVKASNMSVLCNGETVLSAINTSTNGVSQYYFISSSDENGLITITVQGDWIINSIEAFAYIERVTTGNGAFTANKDGNIVIEAENALENSNYANTTDATDGSGHKWTEVAGSSGSAMFFGPNTGAGYTSTTVNQNKGAKMNYTVNFDKTGSYTVWLLVKCNGLEDDSIIIALDSSQSKMMNVIGNTSGYKWVQIDTLTIGTSGEHILNIVGREDGITIDKILLAPTDNTAVDFNGDEIRQ